MFAAIPYMVSFSFWSRCSLSPRKWALHIGGSSDDGLYMYMCVSYLLWPRCYPGHRLLSLHWLTCYLESWVDCGLFVDHRNVQTTCTCTSFDIHVYTCTSHHCKAWTCAISVACLMKLQRCQPLSAQFNCEKQGYCLFDCRHIAYTSNVPSP